MTDLVHLRCPACSSPLQQEAFDHEAGFVKCGYCGALMTLPGSAKGRDRFRERAALPLPERMKLESTAHGILMSRSWFNWMVLFLIPFCVIWNGFLIVWYSVAFSAAETPLMMKLFPLGHVAVGVGLTYFTLATLLNHTRIAVQRGEIIISHGPLPWFGYKRIPGVLIDQVFAKSHVSHGKHGPSVDYQVWIARSEGRQEKLLAQRLTADQALYIEQQIEKALGIQDRPIPGELPRA